MRAALFSAISLVIAVASADGWAQAAGSAPGAAASASEETKTRARTLFQRGIEAYKNGRYKDAIDAFLDAHRLFPNPVLAFNTARAYEKLGDKAGALRFYRGYLRQSQEATDRADVEKRVGTLETALRERGVQQVTILSTPEGATVMLDDRPVGVTPWTGEIFPGKHRLKLAREGFAPLEQEFEQPAHRAVDVSATLEAVSEQPVAAPPAPAPAAPSEERDAPPPADVPPERGVRPLTWAAFGVGAVGFGGALAFELMRQGSEDAVKSERMQIARGEAFDEMESRQTTARVFLVVGSVATLAGGVLLYLDLSRGKEPSPTQVGLGCTTTRCGVDLTGRF